MREVQLYINNQRVDLFKDEQIQVTSSIQNIQDISKVFTDFSQSFTVPCSDRNNSIFDYFYNNDVDGSFKAKERVPARIEINNIPFRSGLVQLEGSEIKNNEAESYKITFFGEVVTLKDTFGEDKLSDLNYDDIAFIYTGDNVKTAISDTSDIPVRFPLISSNRVWEYGTGVEDISTSGGSILFSELYPAIKDKAILDAIANEYGLTFSSNFINSAYFQKSFTYWKNSKEGKFTTAPAYLEFNDLTAGSPLVNSFFENTYIDANALANANNATVIGQPYHSLWCYINISNPTIYFLDIYKNGVLFATQQGSGTGGQHIIDNFIYNDSSLNDNYSIQVRLFGGIGTVSGDVYYSFTYQAIEQGEPQSYTEVLDWTTPINSIYIGGELDLNTTAPDITVAEWFSGILKEFNLTCYPLDVNGTYQVEPVETWYNFGGEVDITEYTDTKSIKVNRPKLYSHVSFEWANTKAFLNEAFEGFFGRKYGNLELGFPYDGKAFKVKLPFENMLFQKFTNTDLQVSYCLDDAVDGKSYVPKPIKLFIDESRGCSFYFNNSVSTSEVTSYVPFGQDQYSNLNDYSQNFGQEQSSLKEVQISDGLYKTFYKPYMQNLFNDKTRIVKVKAHLPLPMLSTLTLDDAVLLRDKKYRINSMKTNLTTGEVHFELISDWLTQTGQPVYPTKPYSGDGGIITVGVKPIKPQHPTKKHNGGGGTVTIEAPLETSFITTTPVLPHTFDGEDTLEIVINTNGTSSERTNTLPVVYKDTQGNVMKTTYIVLNQLSGDSFLLKEDGSYLLLEDLGRIIL